MLLPTSPLARLGAFRTELHACYTRRADAVFELGDALLCAQAVPSLRHLSLEPVCRRGWGSAYAALASGRINVERWSASGPWEHQEPLVLGGHERSRRARRKPSTSHLHAIDVGQHSRTRPAPLLPGAVAADARLPYLGR
jgi:hypothetical protein